MFKKWTSINDFTYVYKLAQKHDITDVKFRFKIKLHGTNAAIRIENNNLIAQSRTSDIYVDRDNAGFAAWVSTLSMTDTTKDLIIYGEWAGPGVHNGDAVSLIDTKYFFVFAIYSDILGYIVEPTTIENIINLSFYDSTHIKVLPWYKEEFSINLSKSIETQEFFNSIVSLVDAIGVVDPYIKEMFGIEGSGEGLVGYPTMLPEFAKKYYSDYLFKVKTENHAVNKIKNRRHIVAEKPEGTDDFINMFFTENRFKQMLNDHLSGSLDKHNLGLFIKVTVEDVIKESVNVLELADFEFKDVAKYGVQVTKNWFLKQGKLL